MKVSPPDTAFPLSCAAALFWAAGALFAQDSGPVPVVPAETAVPQANVVASEEPSVAAELPGNAGKAPPSKALGADLPKPFPVARYSALLEKSPFAVATAAPEAAPPAENFSTNFVITGLAKNRGADGKEVHTVFVRSRDLSTRLVLTGDKPSDEGISVVSVEEAAVAARSVVILKKGAETGRVEFDHAALAASGVGGGQPPPSGAQPVRPGVPGSKAPTSSAARPAIPRPGMSGVPRPGASLNPPAAPAGAAAAPGTAPGGQELRRRVRPIQGAPSSIPEPP